MKKVEVVLQREVFSSTFTLGRLTVDGKHFAYTCEDTDRELEAGGVKIPKQTAIPRGYYRLTATFSQRFLKLMPLIVGVPQFEGVRIHGGNTADDTEGCPLIGRVRTMTGVVNCAERVATLMKMIEDAEDIGNEAWISVQ